MLQSTGKYKVCSLYILYIAAYVQCIRMKKVEYIKYGAKYT